MFTTNNIKNAKLRLSCKYKLVARHMLSEEQKAVIPDLVNESDFYGLLLPESQSGMSIKAVCNSSAEFLLSISNKQGVSIGNSTVSNKNNVINVVEKLLLDGVLEVNFGDGFNTGSQVYDHVDTSCFDQQLKKKISILSRNALQYAQSLNVADARQIAKKLYLYNSRPLSPALLNQFPSTADVEKFMKLGACGKNYKFLSSNWESINSNDVYSSMWFSWVPRSNVSRVGASSKYIFKLYISLKYENIEPIFMKIMDTLLESQVYCVKLAKQSENLVRPDNFIAYFSTLDQLKSAAQKLAPDLSKKSMVGVPFTAQISTDNLLSWGVDSVTEDFKVSWCEEPSWRAWLVNRLGSAMSNALSNRFDSAIQPWKIALRRIQLEGVDPFHWAPINSNCQ